MKNLIIGAFLIMGLNSYAQTPIVKSDFEQITETLMNYIVGTVNGEPEKLKKAFHPNFNLYTVKNDNVLMVMISENASKRKELWAYKAMWIGLLTWFFYR